MSKRRLFIVLCAALFFSISASTTYAADPIAHWRFDEGGGSTATDSSGYGNDGTISGATYSTSTPSGLDFDNPYSLEFDGINDGVSTPLSVNGLSEFTISGWAYPRSAVGGVGWFGANNVVEFIFDDSTTLRCWTSAGAVNWSFEGDDTFLDNWHHITCLGDGSRVTLYVDGEEVASAAHTFTNNYGSGDNFSIGIGVQNGGTSGPFDGFIDDVRVYDEALTPAEMLSLGTGADTPVDNPLLVSLSPADGESDVARDTALVMTFNKFTMHAVEGTVSIYKMVGDELVESIDVDGDGVVPNSAEVTIYPSEPFDPETEYYILVSDGAFADASAGGNPFLGITASSTWNFTTAALTDPEIEAERAVAINKTSARFHGFFLEGSIPFRELGFQYSTSESLEDAIQFGIDEYPSEGNYSLVASDLVCEQTYYFRAYGIDTNDDLWLSSTTKSFTMVSCTDPVDEPLTGADVYNIVQPYTDEDGYFWTSVSVTEDGRRMIATAWTFDPEAIEDGEDVVTQGVVRMSNDHGVSWTPLGNFESVLPIASEISADGQKIIIATLNLIGGIEEIGLTIYTSTDGGLTWGTAGAIHHEIFDEIEEGFEMYLFITLLFTRLHAIDDFSSVYISFFNTLYHSTDVGETWVNLFDTDFIPYFITSFDISADGTRIQSTFTPPFFFGSSGESVLVESEDAGETWHVLFASEDASEPFFSNAMSDDGRRIYVTKFESADMHFSLDGGESWATSTNPDAHVWMYVAVSDTGNGVFASAYDPDTERVVLYYSSNGGLIWEKQLETESNITTDPLIMFLGNASGSYNLDHIGLVVMSRLYVITRGPVSTPAEPSARRRQVSSSPVPCSAARTTFCRAASPAVPTAQTIEGIVAQYRNLFMQAHAAGIVLPQYILDLLGLSTGSVAPTTPIRDLELTMEGEDVRALQTLLMAEGYSIPAGATGYFGSQTQSALVAYQSAHGIIPAIGYFGPTTRAQMKGAGLGGLWW